MATKTKALEAGVFVSSLLCSAISAATLFRDRRFPIILASIRWPVTAYGFYQQLPFVIMQ
jgi:hypothetical protein